MAETHVVSLDEMIRQSIMEIENMRNLKSPLERPISIKCSQTLNEEEPQLVAERYYLPFWDGYVWCVKKYVKRIESTVPSLISGSNTDMDASWLVNMGADGHLL